jgi:putative flippase GtrA
MDGAMKHPSGWTKLLRFCVSGLLATGLHLGIVVVLIVGVGLSSAWANSAAFVCATVGSYLMHTLWSFSSSLGMRNIRRFLVVSCGGVLITWLLSHLMQAAGASPWLGTALVMSVVPPYTFVAHRSWTYRQSTR